MKLPILGAALALATLVPVADSFAQHPRYRYPAAYYQQSRPWIGGGYSPYQQAVPASVAPAYYQPNYQQPAYQQSAYQPVQPTYQPSYQPAYQPVQQSAYTPGYQASYAPAFTPAPTAGVGVNQASVDFVQSMFTQHLRRPASFPEMQPWLDLLSRTNNDTHLVLGEFLNSLQGQYGRGGYGY